MTHSAQSQRILHRLRIGQRVKICLEGPIQGFDTNGEIIYVRAVVRDGDHNTTKDVVCYRDEVRPLKRRKRKQ